eukprot:2498110-Amphidinium_carterae.1
MHLRHRRWKSVVYQRDHEMEREEYERIVTFLASVPLFKQQLPKSLLPMVARDLTAKEWKPGDTLVGQGETGREFYLIRSGEAQAITADSATGEKHVR